MINTLGLHRGQGSRMYVCCNTPSPWHGNATSVHKLCQKHCSSVFITWEQCAAECLETSSLSKVPGGEGGGCGSEGPPWRRQGMLTNEDWVDEVAAGGLSKCCQAGKRGHSACCSGTHFNRLIQRLPSSCHLQGCDC